MWGPPVMWTLVSIVIGVTNQLRYRTGASHCSLQFCLHCLHGLPSLLQLGLEVLEESTIQPKIVDLHPLNDASVICASNQRIFENPRNRPLHSNGHGHPKTIIAYNLHISAIHLDGKKRFSHEVGLNQDWNGYHQSIKAEFKSSAMTDNVSNECKSSAINQSILFNYHFTRRHKQQLLVFAQLWGFRRAALNGSEWTSFELRAHTSWSESHGTYRVYTILDPVCYILHDDYPHISWWIIAASDNCRNHSLSCSTPLFWKDPFYSMDWLKVKSETNGLRIPELYGFHLKFYKKFSHQPVFCPPRNHLRNQGTVAWRSPFFSQTTVRPNGSKFLSGGNGWDEGPAAPQRDPSWFTNVADWKFSPFFWGEIHEPKGNFQ